MTMPYPAMALVIEIRRTLGCAHELAHAAHRIVDGSAYNDVVWDAYTGPCTSFNGCNNLGPTGDNNRRLLESWATGVGACTIEDSGKRIMNITGVMTEVSME